MAAKIPMMATTTKSSISVKPDSLCNLNFCIYSISFYLTGFICYSVFNHCCLFRILEALSCSSTALLDPPLSQDRTRMLRFLLCLRAPATRSGDYTAHAGIGPIDAGAVTMRCG